MGKSIKITLSAVILIGIIGAVYYFFYYTSNMTMDEVIYEESIDSNEDGLREYIDNLDVEWEPGADFQFDNSGL